MKTGVFFHEIFARGYYPILGDKFRNFPKAIERELSLPQVRLYTPSPVSEELLLKVHTKELVEQTKRAWYWEAARISVGGCVEAVEKILSGEIRNALVFDVAAGHHAGRSHAWGGTYLSCTGPALRNAREKFGELRFAILDTDSHHGDGTRDIFSDDPNTLHVCFCSMEGVSGGGTKVDVRVSWKLTDEEYLELVRREFYPRVREFKPALIFHEMGHDTCRGDYGDRGLSPDFFPALVREVKSYAEEICEGRYLVMSLGGARPDLTEYIFPRVLRVLCGEE